MNQLYFYWFFLLIFFSAVLTLYKEKSEFNKKIDKFNKKIDKLYKNSITDPLTGIYNRRFFLQELEEEFARFLRYGSSFCLLLCDIDKLKYINDKYGHLEGDRALKVFARLLKEDTRKEDIVARIGGDEFACILVGSTYEGVKIFIERLRRELKKSYKKENLTFSAGLGCLGKGESFKFYKTYKEFFKQVDKALFKAKKLKDQLVSLK